MKWLKFGAVAFLSVGMLAGCVDDDDRDVDVITPPGNVDTDDGTDADIDVDVDDDNTITMMENKAQKAGWCKL